MVGLGRQPVAGRRHVALKRIDVPYDAHERDFKRTGLSGLLGLATSLSCNITDRRSPSGSDLGSRVGGWPGRSLGSCLTRRVGSHHKGDPPGRPARLEVAHRVRCGA